MSDDLLPKIGIGCVVFAVAAIICSASIVLIGGYAKSYDKAKTDYIQQAATQSAGLPPAGYISAEQAAQMLRDQQQFALGMADNIEDVAVSGDIAQTTASSVSSVSGAFVAFGSFVVVGAMFVFLVLKLKG